MTLRTEDEISRIRQHLADLSQASWLGSARKWWPACLFHCTELSNAVSILSSGKMLSRTQALDTGALQRDIASPEVIAGTKLQWQDYVRLYFRPRTPTQYNNEGFRPVGQWSRNSHCPVPVYFVFDALKVMSHSNSLFSDGNLGSSNAHIDHDVGFLRQIPFNLVYHDTSFELSERDQIVYHRNAEVLVPDKMGLESVRFIGCRSAAEYATLLHLLPPGTRRRWVNKIGIRPGRQLFFKEWTFIEQADLSYDRTIFRFNPNSKTPGPFNARVELVEQATGQRYSWSNPEYSCQAQLELRLNSLNDPFDYTVRLFMDDDLAYASRYQVDDLPF